MTDTIISIIIVAVIFLAGFSTSQLIDGSGATVRNEIHKCESTLPRNQKCVSVITAVPESEVEK